MYRRFEVPTALPPLLARFGIRSSAQVARDLRTVLSHLGTDSYSFGLASAGLLRPDLALPAYAGLIPDEGLAPIFNFFDRTGGGRDFAHRVTRRRMRDFRGGRLSYDEHDGIDFVCPPGTPLSAAAPGVLVAVRDRWLRGGLTAIVDHGQGVVTQYTHLSRLVAELGRPLQRGEVFALSGHSGYDMTQFFPWVPPHLHFMVWIAGRPVDPYLAPGEAPRPGGWLHGGDPRPAPGPLSGDPPPPRLGDLRVDAGALERVMAACRDPQLRAELRGAPGEAARAALLEDSLHHDRFAWPDGEAALDPGMLRPPGEPGRIELTLPLPAAHYRGARAADTRWTRPRC